MSKEKHEVKQKARSNYDGQECESLRKGLQERVREKLQTTKEGAGDGAPHEPGPRKAALVARFQSTGEQPLAGSIADVA
jgi:hypothetical protein